MKIAIASGKGGTGKTFVSTNLFYVAQHSGRKVSLLDCDAEAPNVSQFFSGKTVLEKDVLQSVPVIDSDACVFCGKCFDYCNYNAIFYLPDQKLIQLTEELCHACGACVYACDHGAITERVKKIGTISKFAYNDSFFSECRTEIGTSSSVPVIKEGIRLSDTDNLTFMDSPPGISCPFIATVEDADYVLLVTEPTPFGLNDLKLSMDTLKEMNKPFGVVINRADLGDSSMTDWLKEENIPVLLKIPFDKEIAKIYSKGEVLAAHKPEYFNLFLSLLNTLEHERIIS